MKLVTFQTIHFAFPLELVLTCLQNIYFYLGNNSVESKDITSTSIVATVFTYLHVRASYVLPRMKCKLFVTLSFLSFQICWTLRPGSLIWYDISFILHMSYIVLYRIPVLPPYSTTRARPGLVLWHCLRRPLAWTLTIRSLALYLCCHRIHTQTSS